MPRSYRVRHATGEPVPFHTERGARTHAAIIAARSGRGAVALVEHHTEELGWHPCPGGETLAGHEATPGPIGRPRLPGR